jgi:hypothetical protein
MSQRFERGRNPSPTCELFVLSVVNSYAPQQAGLHHRDHEEHEGAARKTLLSYELLACVCSAPWRL